MAVNQLELSILEADIANAEQALSKLCDQRDQLLKQTEVSCSSCGTKHEIQNVVYLRTHFYVSPHGCTEGDYWSTHTDEFQYKCPSCDAHWRVLRDQQLMALRHLFKETVEVHES